jgi:hypothetical protein
MKAIQSIRSNAMFINYDINAGMSIDAYRKPGFSCGDIGDIVVALDEGIECICAPIDGAVDALCDGFYLSGLPVSQESVEAVYNFIRAYRVTQ